MERTIEVEPELVGIDELRKELLGMPPLISTRRLADLTGEHIGSVRRGIAEGRIPADKINGRWFIPVALLLENTYAFIESRGFRGERRRTCSEGSSSEKKG